MTAPATAIALNDTAALPGLLVADITAAERLHSVTAALLSETQSRLSAAERLITAQEKRIRELEALASTDALTGLMNRRGFENFFKRECTRQRRAGKTGAGCLLLIDLDLFKQINDLCGHQAGDACLQEVADILSRNLRLLDGIARFGGDEFAVLLTDTDAAQAHESIERLRAELNRIEIDFHGKTLRFGASLGMAEVDMHASYAEIYRTADTALYADKQKRRRTQNPA